VHPATPSSASEQDNRYKLKSRGEAKKKLRAFLTLIVAWEGTRDELVLLSASCPLLPPMPVHRLGRFANKFCLTFQCTHNESGPGYLKHETFNLNDAALCAARVHISTPTASDTML
jgi:hypothetical protein